ncbi:hypothetical protein ACFQ2Y_02465 [Streptomyces malaysiensis subsp. malaysiensis]
MSTACARSPEVTSLSGRTVPCSASHSVSRGPSSLSTTISDLSPGPRPRRTARGRSAVKNRCQFLVMVR